MKPPPSVLRPHPRRDARILSPTNRWRVILETKKLRKTDTDCCPCHCPKSKYWPRFKGGRGDRCEHQEGKGEQGQVEDSRTTRRKTSCRRRGYRHRAGQALAPASSLLEDRQEFFLEAIHILALLCEAGPKKNV